MLKYHLMDESEKEIISNWKYEGEYGLYNMPPYREQKEQRTAFGNPERVQNYYTYCDGDRLIGFTSILEKEKEVSIGIGIDPKICGRGYGEEILMLAAEISQTLYPGKPLCLEVRTWNQRAVRCYEKAGFQMDGMPFEQSTPIGKGTFYRMVKDALGENLRSWPRDR